MAKELKELTKRADNYSQWFNDLVVKADMAEQGDWCPERLFPLAHPEIIPLSRGRACRRLC